MVLELSLPPEYISGFVDGEGCFALKYRVDRKFDAAGNLIRQYHYWNAEFAIVLHASDAALLRRIQSHLRVGRISFGKSRNQVRYSVQGTRELKTIIVPFFEQFPLYGEKRKDFLLWAEAVRLLYEHQNTAMVGKERPMAEITKARLEDLKVRTDAHKRKTD